MSEITDLLAQMSADDRGARTLGVSTKTVNGDGLVARWEILAARLTAGDPYPPESLLGHMIDDNRLFAAAHMLPRARSG